MFSLMSKRLTERHTERLSEQSPKQRPCPAHLGVLCLWAWCALAVAQPTPARIITLTPHATELVFAAGAGGQIVGTVESSNFPTAAQAIPRVGNGINTSVEQVLALQPDWIIGWPSILLSQLAAFDIQTLTSSPESLEAIGQTVLDLGEAFETLPAAQAWHKEFAQKLSQLDQVATTDVGTDQTTTDPVRIVVLASSDGQFVIGRHALINNTLKRCGAVNPFAATLSPAPQISPESLIAAKADVIISGTPLDNWQFTAQNALLTVIDPDSLYRPGPRFIDAALVICDLAQQARQSGYKSATNNRKSP